MFPPHFSTRPHTHDEAYLCLVLDGPSVQRSGAVERCRERGRAYFHPAGETHSERFGPAGSRLFCVELGGDASRACEAVRLPGAPAELAGPAALAARRLYLESRFGGALDVEEQTLGLMAALAGARCDGARWAPGVRDYLHAHFAERLTLGRVAAGVGVHPVHLCRAFPQRFGVTLGGYLRALRVDYGARQLAASDRAIAEIALEAGFCSQAHFTREFRRVMGTTPREYRRVLIG